MRALRPLERIEKARAEQSVYADLLAAHAVADPPPTIAPPDVRPLLGRLRHEGATLRGEELWLLATLLEQAGLVAAWRARGGKSYEGLGRLLDGLDPLDGLRRDLVRAIDPSGVVKDDASSDLARARRSIRALRERIANRLESVLRSLGLAESFVTLREGRYVVSVPSGNRRSVPGHVLGHSGSGASVFVEPRDVAEANEELADLEIEEMREVERILRELSLRAHRDHPAIERDFEILARLDGAEAVTAWARESGATMPELSDDEERVLEYRAARHPILVERHRRGEMGSPVALDLRLDASDRVVLVTGPNMGGKTVAMKTVGLLALLAMTGLPVTASSGTRVPWFDRLLCDIGDEQSLQDDVSTFLSHLRRLGEAVRLATSTSLVLLDELGSGTDPAEGAALGRAILESIRDRGALCVATTHFGSLKTFAHDADGVRNASMAFDEEALRSLFRLVVGVPGGSRALQVAERFGMDESVLARARALLPKGEQDLNRLIEELGRLRKEAEAEQAELARTRATLALREGELKTARDRLEAERKERKQSELEARRELLRTLERQIDEYRKRLRTEGKASHETLREVRGAARSIEEAIESETERPTMQAGPPVQEAAPGDHVSIPALNATGVVLSTPDGDGRVRVKIGGATAVLPMAQLRRAGGAAEARAAADAGAKRAADRSAERASGGAPRRAAGGSSHDVEEVGTEIDVRGFEADDAVRAVERFLEDAAMSGHQTARIIHGKGKGILRDQMKRFLSRNSLVKEFRLGEMGEGGTGVTVVTLS
ncbi:MAG TPA: Smr/MutS family protein [Candidatus Eisenbacteria bacterium]|nr:Smr/MutS family protein [Candidatus Eisenbacteria bacterium]